MELVKDIPVEEALKENFTFVDVRTKEEFEEFHIPGAVNVPLFTKEEREKVSKVYYEKGEKEARIFALKVAGPKLYDIVNEIKKVKEKNRNVVIYCWRGGMRSLAVATICSLVGVPVRRLEGGYRAFRKYILRRIEELVKSKKFVILYGPTGVGKTRILRKLKKEGYPVIDLEGLAGHRGSVFGGIGLKQPSQKMFDAFLWLELESLKGMPYIIVEGESKKIGRIFLPDTFFKAMTSGYKINLTMPLEERIRISLEDYKVGEFSKDIYLKSLERIRKILGEEKYNLIKDLIMKESYEEVVKELIVNYYDKLYNRSTPETDYRIEANNLDDAL
ncbi:MAG: tRNA 2-selenouridine(34) synthase MnmH, partial [Desulfurobacteriaceae bacterium]